MRGHLVHSATHLKISKLYSVRKHFTIYLLLIFISTFCSVIAQHSTLPSPSLQNTEQLKTLSKSILPHAKLIQLQAPQRQNSFLTFKLSKKDVLLFKKPSRHNCKKWRLQVKGRGRFLFSLSVPHIAQCRGLREVWNIDNLKGFLSYIATLFALLHSTNQLSSDSRVLLHASNKISSKLCKTVKEILEYLSEHKQHPQEKSTGYSEKTANVIHLPSLRVSCQQHQQNPRDTC